MKTVVLMQTACFLRARPAVVALAAPAMPGIRRKGIAHADAKSLLSHQEKYKRAGFTEQQSKALLTTRPDFDNFVKKSDLAKISAKLDKIDHGVTELRGDLQLQAEKVEHAMTELRGDLKLQALQTKIWFIAFTFCALLLASPEGLASGFVGKLLSALLSGLLAKA